MEGTCKAVAQIPSWVESSLISLRILSGRNAHGNFAFETFRRETKLVHILLRFLNDNNHEFENENISVRKSFLKTLYICSFVLGGNEIAASASVLDAGISKVSAFLCWQRKCITQFLKALRLDQWFCIILFAAAVVICMACSMSKALWISLASSFTYLCCLCYGFKFKKNNFLAVSLFLRWESFWLYL